MSNTRKLASLRAKTDEELLVLIQRELDRALTLADMAVNRESAFYGEAEKAYRKVVTLLPKAPDMRQGERARIEAGVKELRFRLDQVPAAARTQRYPASFQPAVDSDHEAIQGPAYDRWIARGRPIGSPEVDWLQAEEDLKNEGAKATA
jgi:hypothetical protein